MITEDYCSYEVSKLLNEKGLNGMCNTVIGRDGTKYDIKLYDYVEEETISCPTHQMAMKILRDVYDIHIVVSRTFLVYDIGNKQYFVCVSTKEHHTTYDSWYEFHSTYEDAVEAALKYCLENLI